MFGLDDLGILLSIPVFTFVANQSAQFTYLFWLILFCNPQAYSVEYFETVVSTFPNRWSRIPPSPDQAPCVRRLDRL